MQIIIYEVVSVSLRIQKTNPLTLVIDAAGNVVTSKWKNGTLNPHVYIAPPQDGIYGFDFVADEPTGITLQVISPIQATPNSWKGFPSDLKGVKINAEKNSITELLK